MKLLVDDWEHNFLYPKPTKKKKINKKHEILHILPNEHKPTKGQVLEKSQKG
jgi:hypothetical protein